MEHRIRDAKGTILIYKGEPICYNILNTFAEQLEKRISQQAYDAVISINFNPVISDVCQNHKLPYLSLIHI